MSSHLRCADAKVLLNAKEELTMQGIEAVVKILHYSEELSAVASLSDCVVNR